MSEFLGQWIGKSLGDPIGDVLADFDLIEGKSNGTFYLFPEQVGLLSSAVDVIVDENCSKHSEFTKPYAFVPSSGRMLSDEEAMVQFPDITMPKSVSISLELLDGETAKFSWKTDTGTFGEGHVKKSIMPETSVISKDPTVHSWSDFKRKVAELDFGEFVFRGQSKPYPLQTTFHRTNRKNLHRYLNSDIQQLHRALTGRVDHLFDLNDQNQFGAFLNLAQHHGFPTPLLDWTYSPYIAAWFAFSNAKEHDENVRIFALNKKKFTSSFPQMQSLTFCAPHFSIAEVLSVANDRAIPQQGLLTLTNLHDIERYLLRLEKEFDVKVIGAFEMPASEKKQALRELSLMGITRTTLFPSAESVCLDLKDRLFT